MVSTAAPAPTTTQATTVPETPAAANTPGPSPSLPSTGIASLPDPFERNLAPWLVRRLALAERLAEQISEDAQRVQSLVRQRD